MASYAEPSAPEGEAESPAEDSAQGEERDDTLFIGEDKIPGADSLKAGDDVTFKLVGRTSDGELELAFSGKPKKSQMSMEDELRGIENKPSPMSAMMDGENGG